MTLENQSRPGRGGSEMMTGAVVTDSLPLTTDIETACDAYAVLVFTPAGKYRRRVFLSLHSATAAMQRALVKGQPARIVLCRLVPVTADLELDGRWTA